MLQKFVIAAWWPPTMNAVDAYAGAHFNVLLGGNIAAGCQLNGTLTNPATANQAFECIAAQLPYIDSLGLKFIWAGSNTYNSTRVPSEVVMGGPAAFGGVTDKPFTGIPTHSGYPTAPEIAWLLTQLRARNLSHIVEAIELHDGAVSGLQSWSLKLRVVRWVILCALPAAAVLRRCCWLCALPLALTRGRPIRPPATLDITTVFGATADAAAYLRQHAPSVLPLGNAGYGGATSLYVTRMPVMSPEEYFVSSAGVAPVTCLPQACLPRCTSCGCDAV